MQNIIKFNHIKTILMDIEGTTTSISFVHDVLFPYSQNKMANYLASAQGEIQAEISKLESPLATLLGWIEQDKKEPLLKSIQGHIWEQGYQSGELKGHLYPEVKSCFDLWKSSGINLAIYSSGSVKAQKLLFGFSVDGDLCPYFTHHFDTAIGTKREKSSYQNIIEELRLAADSILFLSDIKEELDAAKLVGMQTCQLVRLANVIVGEHARVENFSQLQIN